MSEVYSVDQIVAQGGLIAQAIKNNTSASAIAAKVDTLPNLHLMRQDERDKLAAFDSELYMGVFLTASAIPIVGARLGSHADVDGGIGEDSQRYIFDVNDNKFVKAVSQIAGETAASVKTKLLANPDTNVLTNTEKLKLDNLTYAANISSWQTAFDAALV